MSSANSILKGLFSISFMRLLTAAFSFLLFSFLARKWGAVALGEFSTIFSYFMFLLQMPFLGLHWMMSREVARDPDTVVQQTTNALLVSLSVSVVLLLATGGIGTKLYADNMSASFWLIAVACIPMAFTVVAEAVLAGQQRMQVIASVNIIENMFRVLLCMALVLFGFGVTSLFFAFLLARFLAVAAYWFRGGFRNLVKPDAASMSFVMHYVGKSPTFFAILILSAGIGRLDFIFLSFLGSMQDVGIYSPPSKIYEMGLMVPSVITIVLLPVFSRLFSESRVRFDSLIEAMFKTIFIVGLPMTILLAFLSPLIIPLIFGAEYSGGVPVLQALSFSILFIAMDQVLTVAVLTSNREDLELKILAITFIAYIVLLISLISTMGYYGAALATVLTTSFKFVVRYVLVQKVMFVPSIRKLLFKPALAGGIMFISMYLLVDTSLVLTLVTGSIVYVATLIGLKGVTMSEVQMYRNVLTEGRTAS